METTNPCHEASEAIYEDMGKGATNVHMMKEKCTNKTCKGDSNEPATFMPAERKKKPKRRFTVTVLVVFLFFLALSVLAVAAVAIASYGENTNLRLQVRELEDGLKGTQLEVHAAQEVLGNDSSHAFASIAMRIHNLERQLIQTVMEQQIQSNTTAELITISSIQLNNLQSSVDADRNTTMAQLSSLQSSVDTLNADRDTTTAQLSSLQSSVDTLNTVRDTTTAQLGNLQSSVDTLNTVRDTTTTQLSSLQSTVNTLNSVRQTTTSQLSSLQSTVNTLNSVRQTTTSQLNTLTSRVNSPVNLYQNCIRDTRSCTVTAGADWSLCGTSSLNIYRSGYYTIGMRCDFGDGNHGIETSVIRKSGNNVRCECDADDPVSSNPSGGNFAPACTLTITRCPTRQNIH